VPKTTRILRSIAASLSKFPTYDRSPVSFASPNLLELQRLYSAVREEPLELTNHDYWWKTIDSFRMSGDFRADLEHLARRNVNDNDTSMGTLSFLVEQGIGQMAIHLLPFFGTLIIKCGAKGVIVAMRIPAKTAWSSERTNIARRCVVVHGNDSVVVLKHCPGLQVPPESIINVTGCGDSLVGSILADLATNPSAFDDSKGLELTIENAQRAAVLSLQSTHAVSPALGRQ
jgi:pseudouridylate synthase / pseudouridine kinase